MSFNLNVPYSAQYTTITREGHERPTPIFGAPALIWHLGISPHWEDVRHDDEKITLEQLHQRLAANYEKVHTEFYKDINALLFRLQDGAGFPRVSPRLFTAEAVPPPWPARQPGKHGQPFYVTEPQTMRFTLWWKDDDSRPEPSPTPDALRIKVHVAAHRDFVTVSLHLDVCKLWNQSQLASVEGAGGKRRQRLLSEVQRIRQICEPRMALDADGTREVDREILPELEVSSSDAKALMEASRYLYSSIWDEFCEGLNIASLRSLLGATGRVFANFRGVVLPTDGLPEAVDRRKFPGSSGAEPFPRFVGNGGLGEDGGSPPREHNEANAVVKAFWPFIRRITPRADQREYIACGVMHWRALYITALGSPVSYDWEEEGAGAASEIPARSIPEELIGDTNRYDSLSGSQGEGPLRYLFLTKGEPHRRQIGRIVERINAMGTLRLIALRDWTIIRDASTQIQLRGLELDTMMRKWSSERSAIRQEFNAMKLADPSDKRNIQDREDTKLQELANDVEKDLIYLSAALDEVGLTATHGLHFRVNRTRYYVKEFERLVSSLNFGNIDTWIAYDQFVARGLKPAFDFVDSVGMRLLGLRMRLQSVLEGIETSALVTQTSATRANTAELRRIADTFRRANFWLRVIGVCLAVVTLLVGSGGSQGIAEAIKQLLKQAGY